MNDLFPNVFIYEKWLLVELIWRVCRTFHWINWWNETYSTLLRDKMMRFLTFLMKSNWITDVINLLLLNTIWIYRFLFEGLNHANLAHSPFPIIRLLTLWRLLHILSYVIQSNSTWVMRFIVVIIRRYHLILRLLLLLLWVSKHLAGSLLYNLPYTAGVRVVSTTCAATLSHESSELTPSLVLGRVIFWRGTTQRADRLGSCFSSSLV